jgi:cytochrome c peroxidase
VKKSLLTITSLFCFVVLISWAVTSCQKTADGHNDAVNQEIPAGFPAPVYQFRDNPLSEDGIALGRKLFYDGRLSIDNLHSCASCHQQIGSFGTYEHDRSHGVNSTHTLRNAPVLLNLVWNKTFHWDGEFSTLEAETAHPINGSHEMGETFASIIRKIQDDLEYQRLFRKVFHSTEILPIYIEKALAQFTGTIVISNSRYDKYKKGSVTFTAQEENGYQLFKSFCVSCHTEPLFTDFSYRNIGLPVDTELDDFGRMRITGLREDSLKFRVPTLRNVYISSNYMHDGRFGTLAQVINHYRTGVQQSATLDPLLKNGVTLTNTEAINLALFLRTLTDSSILTNPKWTAPN